MSDNKDSLDSHVLMPELFLHKRLVEIRIGYQLQEIHSARQDDTNRGFVICYDQVDLLFDDLSTYLIQPWEVELPNRYPALGLSLQKIQKSIQPNCLKHFDSPMSIEQVIETDYLGEDTINQICLVLADGSKIIIRHVLPPMLLGIRLESEPL